MEMVGRVGLEPTTKGFGFVQVSLLPGLSHHPQNGSLRRRVPGALGMLIGLAPHILVSAPSHLPILSDLPSVSLAQDCHCLSAEGFPEFTRFFHGRSHDRVTISMSPLL